MPIERPIINYVLKYKEVFDPWELYLFMREWAIEEGWVSRNETEFKETFYLQKETSAGTEIWYWWRFHKPISSFYRYDYKIDAHILFLKPHELIIEGKKLKTFHAEIEFTVRGILVMDQEGNWEKHWLLKHLLTRYFINRIYKKDIEYHGLVISREAKKLQEFLKSYFQMGSFERDREERYFFAKQSGQVQPGRMR
ncbi:hypothetical protein DRJ17_02565 [Candidatus Woesearchaeota archaeon]|nr:MAG: hypothetical protein DRJ17_02565 [Candidatus Woesearchaeota archaeon]